ncbi:MAG: hypothetical protein LBC90_02570 [Candidatus Adiutrix sp.]|jgi:hypothetical protein|nr:hypothetical protein [Candidatus Adiutrix sp.]
MMKTGKLSLFLPFLALIWLAPVWAAGAAEKPSLLLGPAGWGRVDGQDHDLDEMLSLLRPPGAETLAIFAPVQSWKPFYDKIYGRAPIDLSFYAVIYDLSLDDGPDPPDLSDWPAFYQKIPAKPEDVPTALLPPGEPLGPPASGAVTFRTTIGPAGEDGRHVEGKTVYTVFASLILAERRIFFLNLFQIDPGDPSDLERLALVWRAEFLEIPAQVEESAQ